MKKAELMGSIVKHVFTFALLLLFIMPFYLMVINSFKTTQEFITDPFSLPDSFDLTNYFLAFERMNFVNAITNSLIITVISVFLLLVTASMAAHFLVRFRWRITNVIFAIFVASMIVPFQAVMIPLVSLYGGFGLLNNRWILIFMYMGFGQAFAVFIFHGFIKNIPLEIEEAATIDGCGRIMTFFMIVVPMLKPVISTVLILQVLWIWNDFLLPSLILISPAQRTLPLSMFSFFTTFSVDFAPLMAGIVLTIIPILVVYLVCQKQIIEGVSQGAVK